MSYNVTLQDLKTKKSQIEKLANVNFSKLQTESDWHRVFITKKNKILVGRLSFQNETLQFVKWYKPSYIRELDDSDRIKIQVEQLLFNNNVVSNETYDKYIAEVKNIVKVDMFQKMEFRRAYSKLKRRKRLTGLNPRFVLERYIESINKEKVL